MSNQPERDPGAAHGRPARPLLPEVEIVAPPAGAIVAPPAVIMVAPAVERGAPPAVEIVAPPAVAGEQVEMQQFQGVPANPPRNVAEPGLLARVIKCMICIGVCRCAPVADDPASARRTHYLSNFITRVQCFLLPTKKSESLKKSPLAGIKPSVEEVLGFRVQFKKGNCDLLNCSCQDCGACPHMYSCTCPDRYKHKGTKWCAHIHTMHTLTKGKFAKKMCLYIQTDIRYTLMRHIRAIAQGDDFMKLNVSNFYEAKVDNFGMSEKASVELTTINEEECVCGLRDKCRICRGCWCRFDCTCQDFLIDQQVCQHIQSVALFMKQKTTFYNFEMPMDFSYLLYALEDPNLKYYVELEHEMSFYIDQHLIFEQSGSIPKGLFTKSFLQFERGRVCSARGFGRDVESASKTSSAAESALAELNVASGSKKRRVQDKWWILYRDSSKWAEECKIRRRTKRCICRMGPPRNSTCSRCKICYLHYECTCPLDSTIICRHVHAVHRLEARIEDTEEKAASRVKSILSLPAICPNIQAAYENWLNHFVSRREPSVAGESDMDILPLPPFFMA